MIIKIIAMIIIIIILITKLDMRIATLDAVLTVVMTPMKEKL